jgi:hypothetical protein
MSLESFSKTEGAELGWPQGALPRDHQPPIDEWWLRFPEAQLTRFCLEKLLFDQTIWLSKSSRLDATQLRERLGESPVLSDMRLSLVRLRAALHLSR